MKLHYVLLLFCGVVLAAVAGATWIYSRHQAESAPVVSQQVFQVKGEVRSIEPGESTIHIAHEEIPGFMPAMQMPFTVKDTNLIVNLKPGDLVNFELVVAKDDSWITRITRSGSVTRSAESGSSNTAAQAADDLPPLRAGHPVPDFELVNQDGQPFRLRDLRGKAVLVTFIYTRCPLPNYCPLMSRNFATLQEKLNAEFPGKVELISVSFDPEYDKPMILKQYASQYQKSGTNWIFATGSPAQVNNVANLFGLIREVSGGLINHDLRTALIDSQGRLVHLWRSNVWTPEEVAARVRETLSSAG